jgi:hypothetical protein
LEIWWAEGRFGQLPELAADLVRWKPDVLVTAGPYGLQAARRATTTIPIVMIACDPAETMVERLIVLPDPRTLLEGRRIADLATKHRMPAIYGFKEFVGAGGLMSYGTMQTDLYQRAAGHTQGSPWRQASRRSGGAAYKVRVRH